MRLLKLPDNDKEAKKLRSKRLSEGLKDIKKMLYYQNFLYIYKVIHFEMINKCHDNLFAGYFGIEKT